MLIEKHRNLIEQYTREYEEVKKLEEALKQQIDREKQEQIARQERREVLKEKKKLLLYQIEKLQQQLFNRIQTAGNLEDEALTQLRRTLPVKIKELNKAKQPELEETLIGEIKTELEKISQIDKVVGVINRKLDEIKDALMELQTLNETNTHLSQGEDGARQIKEFREKQRWLQRRIESHQQALNYWLEKTGDAQ
jgi:chromosome segregation ATPase